MSEDNGHRTRDAATATVLPSAVVDARSQLTQRRGLTGRWYRAEAVDDLLDALTGRLAGLMTEVDRLRRLNRRLIDIDHRRRFGTLPSGIAAETLPDEAIQRQIDEQETVDQIIEDASQQAATIIREAREQYLRSAAATAVPSSGTDADRADRAEAMLRQARGMLERWTRVLLDRDATHRRSGAQRSSEFQSAYEDAVSMIAAIDAAARR